MPEPLLLTCVQISTYLDRNQLTNATGFFFARDRKLFLVTSRHVLRDEQSAHFPDRVEIEIHNDPQNLAISARFSIPLYKNGRQLWRQSMDSGGNVDVAAIELVKSRLPANAHYYAFTPEHLPEKESRVRIGSNLLIAGFPLGFHDNLHHLPIVRRAVNASSFALRFQGKGYFLTDARTHRGMSGAPVVMYRDNDAGAGDNLPWILLGIHSARLDMGSRDLELDEALGLNCAWFADIIISLTGN